MEALSISKLYTLFNNKLGDFLEDLGNVIGYLPEYSLMKTSMIMVSSINASKNHSLFAAWVKARYGEYLRAHDEHFFMQQDYADLAVYGEQQQSANASSFDLIALLKREWSKLSASDKDAIWGHLDALVQISDCIERRQTELV